MFLSFPAGQSPGFPVLVAAPRYGPVPRRAEQASAGRHPRGLRPQLLHGLRGEHPGRPGQVARYFTLLSLKVVDPGDAGFKGLVYECFKNINSHYSQLVSTLVCLER